MQKLKGWRKKRKKEKRGQGKGKINNNNWLENKKIVNQEGENKTRVMSMKRKMRRKEGREKSERNKRQGGGGE